MTLQLIRPKDLGAAGPLTDSDYLIIDQGASGVKHIAVGVFRSVLSVAGAFATNLSGEDPPEGVVPAPDGTIYIRTVSTPGAPDYVREWYYKSPGGNGSD